MDATPNLGLPYILAAQAQKHVTHNEAIRALDALVQVGVKDRDLASPPGAPEEGDRYIVPAGADGAWSGEDGKIAAWQDAAWAFYAPVDGWLAWVADEGILVAFDGADWIVAAAPGTLQDLPMVGVNATADASNRLALASNASLFNHDGAGHQQKINKATTGDTASQLFQTGFSGRAEYGLTGDDDFHFKVSPDGSAWKEALIIDKDDGNIGVGASPIAARRMTLATPGTSTNEIGCTVENPTSNANGQIITEYRVGGGNRALLHVQRNGTGAGGTFLWRTEAPAGGAVTRLTIDHSGNVALGPSALATDASDGFLHVPSCAGTPTGTPTTFPGRVPIVVDTTSNKLYFYSSGAWRDAGP